MSDDDKIRVKIGSSVYVLFDQEFNDLEKTEGLKTLWTLTDQNGYKLGFMTKDKIIGLESNEMVVVQNIMHLILRLGAVCQNI